MAAILNLEELDLRMAMQVGAWWGEREAAARSRCEE